MKLFYSIELLVFCICMFIPVQIHAQEWHEMSEEEIRSIMNPDLLDEVDQIVRFDSIVTNIGTMTEDDKPILVKFGFKNLGNQPLIITRIRTDCGCTKGKVDKLSYKTDEKGIVTIEYNPRNHPGTIDAKSFVYSSLSDTHPIAKLTILGEVFPSKDIWNRYRYSIGTLKLKQNKVVFNFKHQEKLTERILCGNSGSNVLKISARNLPEYITFRTEPTTISPGEEADIVIRVDATKVDTEGKIVIPIELDGISSKETSQNLVVEINKNK